MLILTRKVNQSITLGSDIRVVVLDVDGERVSIGIDAPKEIRIFRSELIEDTLTANKESQHSAFFNADALKKKGKPPEKPG